MTAVEIEAIEMRVCFKHDRFGSGYFDCTISRELWEDKAALDRVITSRIEKLVIERESQGIKKPGG